VNEYVYLYSTNYTEALVLGRQPLLENAWSSLSWISLIQYFSAERDR